MKLEKVIAVRTAKTVYRDGNRAVKVFDEDYKKSDILNEALNQRAPRKRVCPCRSCWKSAL